MSDEPLISVRQLVKHFPVPGGFWGKPRGWVKAVDGVSFDIYPGETLGLVGESGCGKSTLGRTLMRLLEPTSGEAYFEGKNIFGLSAHQMRQMRREMQIIFQDPYASLNPRMTIGNIVAEPLVVHKLASGKILRLKVAELLERVGLRPEMSYRYPHEFSGGQRQRVGIARALALRPKFIVADEPISALDVSIQAQIINLLMDLQQEFELTYLFIAHDLHVVRHISSRVAVMYLGKIVESLPAEDIPHQCKHPYTQALLSAVPQLDPRLRKNRVILSGDVPSPIDPPSGCVFHTRCPVVQPECSIKVPELASVKSHHQAACPPALDGRIRDIRTHVG